MCALLSYRVVYSTRAMKYNRYCSSPSRVTRSKSCLGKITHTTSISSIGASSVTCHGLIQFEIWDHFVGVVCL